MRFSAAPLYLAAALTVCGPVLAHDSSVSPAQRKVPFAKFRRAADPPYGRPGDAERVKRVISIDMSDTMRFFPSELRVKRGQTVRFELRNSGDVPHEMVIGTMDELKKRAALMKGQGDVQPVQHEVTRVLPSESTRLVWQFTRAGEFYYGCLEPGHFEAGMIGTIVVR